MHPTDHWFRQFIFHTSSSQGLTSLYGSHYVYETFFQSSKCRAQCGAHSSQHGLSSGPHSRVFSRHQAQRPCCMSAGPYFQWPLSLSLTVSAVCSPPTLVFLPYPSLPRFSPRLKWIPADNYLQTPQFFFYLVSYPKITVHLRGRGGHTITTKRKQNKERNAKPNQTKQKIKTHHSYPRSLQSKSWSPLAQHLKSLVT